jgi:hypothetical protein
MYVHVFSSLRASAVELKGRKVLHSGVVSVIRCEHSRLLSWSLEESQLLGLRGRRLLERVRVLVKDMYIFCRCYFRSRRCVHLRLNVTCLNSRNRSGGSNGRFEGKLPIERLVDALLLSGMNIEMIPALKVLELDRLG